MEIYSKPIDIRKREPYPIHQFALPSWAKNDLKEILISEGEIKSRVEKLSEEICEFYHDKNPLVLPMLNGAVTFYNDLFRNLPIKYSINFILASSYPVGTESAGEPHIYLNDKIQKEISGRHILEVEDIFDTGETLNATNKLLWNFEPLSIETIVLTDKPERRKPHITIKPRWTGFIIPNKFVVGYGLDFNERYRGIKHIAVLKPEIYETSR